MYLLTRIVSYIFKITTKKGTFFHINENKEQGKDGLILSFSHAFFFVKL